MATLALVDVVVPAPPLTATLRARRIADGALFDVRRVDGLHAVYVLQDLPLYPALVHPHVVPHVAALVAPGFCAVAKAAPVASSRATARSVSDILARLVALSSEQKRVLAAQAVSAVSFLHSRGFLCMYDRLGHRGPRVTWRGAVTRARSVLTL